MKRAEMQAFLQEMNKMFTDQMQVMVDRKMLKKSKLEDMKAGFSDGTRITLTQLIERGHLKVEE